MVLTDEQRKMVEDHLWVVNTILKETNLQREEDLRQECYLYLCKCAVRFDPSFNTKFGTYAFANIRLYIKRVYGKECARTAKLAEYEDGIEAISGTENQKTSDLVNDIILDCSEEEQKIVRLYMVGMNDFQIANVIGCSERTARRRRENLFKKIREKFA